MPKNSTFKKFGMIVTKNYRGQRAKIWHFYLHTQGLQLHQIYGKGEVENCIF